MPVSAPLKHTEVPFKEQQKDQQRRSGQFAAVKSLQTAGIVKFKSASSHARKKEDHN
jgi:hypothetical protein